MQDFDSRVEVTFWQGEPAIQMYAGGYQALIVHGVGANLIELKNKKKNLDILRGPGNISTLKTDLPIYGIPVLFPPNRIAGGKFTAAEKEYFFPINDVWDMPNHLHGFLYDKKWDITNVEIDDTSCSVQLTYVSDKNSSFISYFPHEFEFRLTYSLSENGIVQTAVVTNLSTSDMPFGLGFHTAFNLPFDTTGDVDMCNMIVSIDKRWELDSLYIPTGELIPLEKDEKSFIDEGMHLHNNVICHHYTAEPLEVNGSKFHGAIICDHSNGRKLIYEVDAGYGHWMLWNGSGKDKFICPEPQTMAADAPNMKDPQISGFKLLHPGEIWTGKSTIRVED